MATTTSISTWLINNHNPCYKKLGEVILSDGYYNKFLIANKRHNKGVSLLLPKDLPNLCDLSSEDLDSVVLKHMRKMIVAIDINSLGTSLLVPCVSKTFGQGYHIKVEGSKKSIGSHVLTKLAVGSKSMSGEDRSFSIWNIDTLPETVPVSQEQAAAVESVATFNVVGGAKPKRGNELRRALADFAFQYMCDELRSGASVEKAMQAYTSICYKFITKGYPIDKCYLDVSPFVTLHLLFEPFKNDDHIVSLGQITADLFEVTDVSYTDYLSVIKCTDHKMFDYRTKMDILATKRKDGLKSAIMDTYVKQYDSAAKLHLWADEFRYVVTNQLMRLHSPVTEIRWIAMKELCGILHHYTGCDFNESTIISSDYYRFMHAFVDSTDFMYCNHEPAEDADSDCDTVYDRYKSMTM